MALARRWHAHLRRTGVQCCGRCGPGDRGGGATATVRSTWRYPGAGQEARSSGPICCCWGCWRGGVMARLLATDLAGSPEPHPAVAGLALGVLGLWLLYLAVWDALGILAYAWSCGQPAARGADRTPWAAPVGLVLHVVWLHGAGWSLHSGIAALCLYAPGRLAARLWRRCCIPHCFWRCGVCCSWRSQRSERGDTGQPDVVRLVRAWRNWSPAVMVSRVGHVPTRPSRRASGDPWSLWAGMRPASAGNANTASGCLRPWCWG